jgi:hypothetical protein
MGLTMSSLQLSQVYPPLEQWRQRPYIMLYCLAPIPTVSLNLALLFDQLLTRAMASPMRAEKHTPNADTKTQE